MGDLQLHVTVGRYTALVCGPLGVSDSVAVPHDDHLQSDQMTWVLCAVVVVAVVAVAVVVAAVVVVVVVSSVGFAAENKRETPAADDAAASLPWEDSSLCLTDHTSLHYSCLC